MSQNRALGIGLVALGAVLGGLIILNLLANLIGGQLQPGAAILGLLIAAVLGLPLVGGGLYVLSRGRQELAQETEFRTQRRTFEQDRMFRAEQARELAQLAARLDRAGGAQGQSLAARLRDLAHDFEAPGYDQAAWYEAVELGRADLDAIRRYDDVLADGVRTMGRLVGELDSGEAVLPRLRSAVDEWERDAGQRADLLRGRRAPTVSPGDILRAERPASEAVAALKLGDAVSWDGDDYLVETSISYFLGGRTWWLHRLRAEQDQRWLLVSPGGLSLAQVAPTTEPIEPGATAIAHGGETCRLEESGTASAQVRSQGGPDTGGTVAIWRYDCPGGALLWLERWSDGQRSYAGRGITPTVLEIYPSAADAGPGPPM